MTIFSDQQRALTRSWEIAALDIPVPSDLTNPDDRAEWARYLKCLSPGKQLQKFGEALDQFFALAEKAPHPLALPAADQAALFSKWQAAQEASAALDDRLKFPRDSRNSGFRTDIDETLFHVIDLLWSVNSPDSEKWEERAAFHSVAPSMTPLANKILHGIQPVIAKRPVLGVSL